MLRPVHPAIASLQCAVVHTAAALGMVPRILLLPPLLLLAVAAWLLLLHLTMVKCCLLLALVGMVFLLLLIELLSRMGLVQVPRQNVVSTVDQPRVIGTTLSFVQDARCAFAT